MSDINEYELPASSQRRIELQHEIICDLIKPSEPQTTISPELLKKINELKALVQDPSSVVSTADIAILVTFATAVITAIQAPLINGLIYLLTPTQGYVSWWNDTGNYVRVRTFDEGDGLRWIPYEERVVAPQQAVRLTARGNFIHIHTPINGALYDCDKGQANRFDGTNVEPKIS